jgi:hypothetical protein
MNPFLIERYPALKAESENIFRNFDFSIRVFSISVVLIKSGIKSLESIK